MRNLIVIALLGSIFSSGAQEAGPSPAHPMGWRGDGTGRYPNANPSLDWGRIAKSVKELSAQARKPKGDAPPPKEASIADGTIHEWLVLGPLPNPKDSKTDDFLPDIDKLSPDEGDKALEHAWQAVKVDTSCLDLCAAFNVPFDRTEVAAYAHTYIYSPSGQPVAYNIMFQGQGTNRVWLNGAAVYSSPKSIDIGPGARLVLPLKKGWNRLLVLNAKSLNFRKSWWICGSLFGDKIPEYESHGIVWKTTLPASGSSAPVILGDRIVFTLESGCVMCLNKADGKPLWARTLTFYDFATDEEKKANAALFAEMAALDEKLKKTDLSDMEVPWKMADLEAKFRWSIEGQLYPKMAKVSHEKYGPPAECEVGVSAPTPITDGEFIYAVFGNGICVCYDRNGNCKWKKMVSHKPVEHGYTASPLLVDGKLVVYFDTLTIFNAKTGDIMVERPHYLAQGTQFNWYTHFHGIGTVLNAGNEKVIYYLNGEFVRLSDGKTLDLDDKKLNILGPENHTNGTANRIAATLVEDGVAYKVCNISKMAAFKLPALAGDKVDPQIEKEIPINTPGKFPYYYEYFYDASPLLHDGLIYLITNMGGLSVIDVKTGETLYQRQLDLEVFMPYNSPDCRLKGGASASPTLGGKYIFIFGNQGAVVVIEPGRAFKQVAKLRLESFPENQAPWSFQHQDVTMTEPVFEGERIYYRSENAMFCLGSK